MSLNKIVQDYIQHRDIVETEFEGVLLQYYKKLNIINIYAPKGVNVKLFMTIKERFKNIDENTMIFVNW